MDREKFNIGDRVILLKDHPDSNEHLVEGDIGVVMGYTEYSHWVHVDWGRDINGHTCDHTCKDGQGWDCEESILKLVIEKDFEPCTFDELMELIIGVRCE